MNHARLNFLNALFDDVVHGTARWLEERNMHAFGICWGLALVATPLAAAIGASSWRGAVALFGALLLYIRAFLPAKRRLLPGARRKLLIDFSLFRRPGLRWTRVGTAAHARAVVRRTVSRGADGDRRAALWLLFSGCCHGRPSRWGPRYLETRVLPLPLLESSVAALLLTAAGVSLCMGVDRGALASCLALSYVAYRFFAEFFRARSGEFRVRRFAGLSLTQWLCAMMFTGSAVGGVL